jgi:hypothetical protein
LNSSKTLRCQKEREAKEPVDVFRGIAFTDAPWGKIPRFLR